jgi:hypothetical protein
LFKYGEYSCFFWDYAGSGKEVDEPMLTRVNLARMWRVAQFLVGKDAANYADGVSETDSPFNGTAMDWIKQKSIALENSVPENFCGAGRGCRTDFGEGKVKNLFREIMTKISAKLKAWLLLGLAKLKLLNFRRAAVSSCRKRRLAARRACMQMVGLGLMGAISACSRREAKMQTGIVLDVEMYSYLSRPIHYIIFNGADLGVMNSYGGTGTITGVWMPFGMQSLKWTLGGPEGMPGNGEQITVKNKLIVSPEKIPPRTRYIGLHLYPDYTAELTFSDEIPEKTIRGKKITSESDK